MLAWLDCSIDRVRLENAFRTLVGWYEILRTSFDVVDGDPVQIVHGSADFNIAFYIAGCKDVNEIIKDFIRPFDLRMAPLFRILLEKSPKNRLLPNI